MRKNKQGCIFFGQNCLAKKEGVVKYDTGTKKGKSFVRKILFGK
jgi:hypothetical protein